MPNVERALTEMEMGMGGPGGIGATPDAARRTGRTTGAPSGRPAGLSAAGGASATGRAPTSPTTGGSASPPAGQTQHEVLQNFFLSLLNTKDRGGAGPPAAASGRTATPRSNGNTSGTEEG